MKNIIRLYTTGDSVNMELALTLFNGLTTYQTIRFMIEMGWKIDMLKELKETLWFTSWQEQAQSNFIYLTNTFGIDYWRD